MAAEIVVLAHAGHIYEGLAFAAPALILPVVLMAITLRDRRRERGSSKGGWRAGSA